jgi:very-short-patch-repair endonuclease
LSATPIAAFFKDEIMRGLQLHERNRSRDLRKNQTSAEQQLWRKLRGRQLGGCKFVRQEPIGPYFADFVCREHRLIVEVDGATHSTDEELARDANRERFLHEAGYGVLRVTNDEVFNNLDGVCETILAALQARATS